ncbi:unnamed protein product [Anisakis simplex]|uniref:Uncharacterized protein n=1 Tax=Anisakis simplex TaxID=6269 RepID=A0A3P6QQD8_ANISI|nr:unnamed protein product [Anisakis simplex]
MLCDSEEYLASSILSATKIGMSSLNFERFF